MSRRGLVRAASTSPARGAPARGAPARVSRRVSRRGLFRAATLVAAVAFDVLFFRPGGGPALIGFPKAPGDPLVFAQGDFAAAMAVQERYDDDLLAMPGVAGTAVGLGVDGRPVVKVYVTGAHVTGLPVRLDGHALAVEVTGAFRALNGDDGTNPRAPFSRPVPIGVSTGQVDVTAGTIGARVIRGGDVFALSNNHVYANKNDANVGDNILQPGRVDGGRDPADVIGTLHDFKPIRFCSPFPMCPSNEIDAAIAATDVARLGNGTPSNGYGMPRRRTAPAKLGMAVQKYGRTTGHTTGQISGINATVNVGFRDGTARFTGQIVINKVGFSGPGDSGSLIVTAGAAKDARRPVGLLFAGSQTSTLANPIGLVLDHFGVEIDGN